MVGNKLITLGMGIDIGADVYDLALKIENSKVDYYIDSLFVFNQLFKLSNNP
ncbi:hypothetical protein LCGC14_2294630 [marine sediment metagenome]|uniref:Uncharacterized protein n=1 Tax=marine sediment metagenome TaxID=412755 RepID=A0A0F9CQQ3_9ZZZZ